MYVRARMCARRAHLPLIVVIDTFRGGARRWGVFGASAVVAVVYTYWRGGGSGHFGLRFRPGGFV